VELLYVLIIVGIVAGVAAPLLDVARFRMNSVVIEVATELMAAQRAAILRGHNMVVVMDQSGNRLRVHADANNDGMIQSSEMWKVVDLPEGVTFGLEGAPKLSQFNPPFTFKKKQGTYPAVTFHRNGSASEQGIIYLVAEGGGKRAENSRAVEVIRSTAKVKCWSYTTGTWMETC
jgi:Tfp pilus assembly protein FimT